MKKYCRYSGILLAILLIVVSTSCKKKVEPDPNADVKGHYFSIRQFAVDEWNTFAGAPFTILKTVKTDGKIDSSYTNSDTINWNPIFKVFFETDISDRKFLGKYKFTQFDDNQDGTHNFFYEAEDADLLTQKLLLTIDQFTRKVKGIYIATRQKSLTSETIQKLYYAPMQTIQIQTDYKPIFGDKKFTVVQYEFLR